MDFSQLYSDKILEIAGNPRPTPRLAAPDASARKVSRVCGSQVEIDLALEGDTVRGYGADVSACALGQTSAAIVADHIIGERADRLRALRENMRAMLKEGGPAPEGAWSDLGYLMPVKDYPARHASTLLVFDAVVDALDKAGR